MDEATTYRTEEQAKRRAEIYDAVLGDLELDARPVGEIELETGIKPPSWFKATQGVTMSEIGMITQRGRR